MFDVECQFPCQVLVISCCFIQYRFVCLREACESALKEKHFLDVSPKEGFSDEDPTSHSEQIEVLERVFSKAAEDDMPTEVSPSPISYHVFIEVATPNNGLPYIMWIGLSGILGARPPLL